MVKKVLLTSLLAAIGLLFASGMLARSEDGAMVQVPFAFAVGTQMLPAGSYRVKLVTNAQPGAGALEVVVLRGETRDAYASFVSRVVEGHATNAGFTFQRLQGQEFLTEIRAQGKRLEPSPLPAEIRAGDGGAKHELIAQQILFTR